MTPKSVALIAFIGVMMLLLCGTDPVSASCPVCAGAAAGGTILARWLGVSDLAIGIWQGALAFSLGVWFADLLRSKINIFDSLSAAKTKAIFCPITVLFFVTTYHITGIMEGAEYLFWYLDKLVLGTVGGGFLAWIVTRASGWIKSKNNGKVIFQFQITAMVLAFTLSVSGVMQVIS